MATAPADPRIEEWFDAQSRTIGPIAAAARELLDEGLPGARVAIKWGYPTWVGKGNVAAIQAFTEHVNLQFYRGTSLADPERVLEGTGKELRHVTLRHARDARTPQVKGLVRSAWRVDQQGEA